MPPFIAKIQVVQSASSYRIHKPKFRVGICDTDDCCDEAEALEPKTMPLLFVALLVRTGNGLAVVEDAAE